MKQLWILRHGKAVEASPRIADAQRPLTPAGREQSRAMGDFLRGRNVSLDRAVCSSSVRTRETAEAALEAGQYRIPLDLTESIYEAAGSDLIETVRGLKDRDSGVLLVGHMPGVGELVSALVTDQDDLALVFKPGTLMLVTLDVEHWSKVHPGKGDLAILVPPPSLA
jgi:phosphohistidine phosphatase